jgi:hypothetical protein
MGVRESVVRGDIASEHIVQLFDSEESRADSVARFLTDGFRHGEPAIVIARPTCWAAIIERLEVFRVPTQKRLADGSLIVKDAADTLQRLMRFGVPDRQLLDSVVGKTVEGLCRRGRVRAYGEMVDLLAERGEMNEALALEAVWSEFAERTPLFIMCGYSAAHFVSTGTHRALRDICKGHTQVHQHAHDPLANWLLTTAHGNAAQWKGVTTLPS